MPLIEGFRATSIKKAFLLNAIACSLIVTIALIAEENLEARTDLAYTDKWLMVLVVTFVSAIIVYSVLRAVFGFGGGMLA